MIIIHKHYNVYSIKICAQILNANLMCVCIHTYKHTHAFKNNISDPCFFVQACA